MKQNIFDVSLKTIGLVHVNSESLAAINSEAYTSFIKVLYLTKNAKLKVDFDVYST